MVWSQQLLILPGSEHGRIIFWLDNITILYISLYIILIVPLSSLQGCTLNLHILSKLTLLSPLALEEVCIGSLTWSLSQHSWYRINLPQSCGTRKTNKTKTVIFSYREIELFFSCPRKRFSKCGPWFFHT